MRTLRVIVASSTVLLGSAVLAGSDGGTPPPRRPTQLDKADGGVVAIPLSKMPWEKSASGLNVVPFWGDASHTGFMRMLKMKAGEKSFVHWHPQDKHGLVVEGTFSQDPVNVPQDGSRKLGPGGYFGVPAKTVHTTYCWPGKDCVVLYFMPGPLETIEVTADGGTP